jgi:Holliday junction resolvase RusA-like endonuclease
MSEERISFVIPGTPRGKGRPKFARMKDKEGKPFVRTYSDDKTMAYEDQVKFYASRVMAGRPPLEGEVAIEIIATFEMPKSMTKKRRALAMQDRQILTTSPRSSAMA